MLHNEFTKKKKKLVKRFFCFCKKIFMWPTLSTALAITPSPAYPLTHSPSHVPHRPDGAGRPLARRGDAIVKVDFILQERKRGTPPCGAKRFCSPGRNACVQL
jgi:hypothetical protein